MREFLIWRSSYVPGHLGFAAARRVSRTTRSAPDGLQELTAGDRGLDRFVSGLSSRSKGWRQPSQQCGSGPCYLVVGLKPPPFVGLITRRTDDVHVHASICCLRCAARKLHLARPGSANLQQPGRRMEKPAGFPHSRSPPYRPPGSSRVRTSRLPVPLVRCIHWSAGLPIRLLGRRH